MNEPRRGRRRREAPAAGPEALVERIDAAAAGSPPPDTVPTGFGSVDRLLGGGLRRQDLIVLGGDVGSGKSSLALSLAVRTAAMGHPALLLSGEMTPERLYERALAAEGRVSIDQLRQGRLSESERAAVGGGAVRLRGLPLAIRPLTGSGPEEIGRAVEELAVPRRSLLVVDSLQVVDPGAAPLQAERLAAAARLLKSIALTRDLAVLVTAHLPMHRADRPDPRPTLDDLGGLGAIKQVADLVLLLYREEMYRPGLGMEGAAELLVAKNRNGPTGFVDLYFYAKWLRIEDMLDPEP